MGSLAIALAAAGHRAPVSRRNRDGPLTNAAPELLRPKSTPPSRRGPKGGRPWTEFERTHRLRNCRRSGEARARSATKLRELPAAGDAAGDEEQHNACAKKNADLVPEFNDGQVAPEDFGESVDGPGVERPKASLLHGV